MVAVRKQSERSTDERKARDEYKALASELDTVIRRIDVAKLALMGWRHYGLLEDGDEVIASLLEDASGLAVTATETLGRLGSATGISAVR